MTQWLLSGVDNMQVVTLPTNKQPTVKRIAIVKHDRIIAYINDINNLSAVRAMQLIQSGYTIKPIV